LPGYDNFHDEAHYIIITESSTGKATFIEINFSDVSIGYTAKSTYTTYLRQGEFYFNKSNYLITWCQKLPGVKLPGAKNFYTGKGAENIKHKFCFAPKLSSICITKIVQCE